MQHGADRALDPDAGVKLHDDAENQHEARQRVTSDARRIAPMSKKWLKYARQITTPLTNNTSMHNNRVQNSSFCPAFYLPMGGTPSSRLTITRSMRRNHRRSLAVMKLARQKRPPTRGKHEHRHAHERVQDACPRPAAEQMA